MLHLFLSNNRNALIDRCLLKVAQRSHPQSEHSASLYGIPVFLDQVIETLQIEQTSSPLSSREVSGPAGGPSKQSDLGQVAKLHGRELSEHGFTVEQVVHDYGDLCQAITELASEFEVDIQIDEFRTLNRCLDNGIADAVTEFSYQRRLVNDDREEQALNHRMGVLIHEMRDHLNAAVFAVAAIKSGQAGFGGATGAVLDRSLAGMRTIVDRSFADASLVAGLPVNHEMIVIDDFVAKLKMAALVQAKSHGCEFAAYVVGLDLAVQADSNLLSSAVGNLLQNAFKFTHPGSSVSLTAYAEGDQVLMDVQDHCGGLGHINKEDLFLPFKQMGTHKTGVGLGLSICRRSVEANHGTLSVRDLPGSGCVFTISLPRCAMPGAVSVASVDAVETESPV
jgi:hypothetical protein